MHAVIHLWFMGFQEKKLLNCHQYATNFNNMKEKNYINFPLFVFMFQSSNSCFFHFITLSKNVSHHKLFSYPSFALALLI